MSKENTIFLTLPNVGLGESLLLESDNCLDIERIQGQCETEPSKSFNDTVENQIHGRNMSPELQDVYRLLAQLPKLSFTSWNGFRDGSSSSSSSVKNHASRPIPRKQMKTPVLQKTHSLQGGESLSDDEPQEKRRREPVKMHQINLYQSILPQYMFSRK